jgi:hypothetical protein
MLLLDFERQIIELLIVCQLNLYWSMQFPKGFCYSAS